MNTETRNADNKKWFSSLGMRYFAGSLIFIVVQLLIIMIAQMAAPEVYGNYYLLIAMLPTYLIAFPLFVMVITKNMPGVKVGEPGFKKSTLVLALFVSLGLMYVGNLVGTIINMILAGIAGGSGANAMANVITGSSVLQNILVVVIAAPIVEEFLFRKFLVDRLAKYGQGVAIVVSAVTFGLYHGNFIQLVYATLLGLVLAYVYVKSGKIIYTIILHILINFWGSIVPVVVMQISHYNEYAALAASGEASASELSAWVMSHLGGMALFGGFAILQMVLGIVGVVLFFVNLKKVIVNLQPGEETLPQNGRIQTILLNPGVLLYVLLWIGMAVYTVMSI